MECRDKHKRKSQLQCVIFWFISVLFISENDVLMSRHVPLYLVELTWKPHVIVIASQCNTTIAINKFEFAIGASSKVIDNRLNTLCIVSVSLKDTKRNYTLYTMYVTGVRRTPSYIHTLISARAPVSVCVCVCHRFN